jgi:hypothetical protein
VQPMPLLYCRPHINIYADEWLRLLRQASTGTSLAVVVPVPLDGSPADTFGTLLREALLKVPDRERPDAVTGARKAIQELDGLHGCWPTLKEIADFKRDDRTLDQRLALLRHALHTIANLNPHTGAVATSVRWDPEKALAVIAGTAALAACPEARTPRPSPADMPTA